MKFIKNLTRKKNKKTKRSSNLFNLRKIERSLESKRERGD